MALMDVVKQILISFLLQMVCTVGVVVVVGLIISYCNKWFYRSFGRSGRGVMMFTGVIGTPIHETGHALACVVFGHKVKEICLFKVSDDGILGYVNHSYNPKNIYQRAGNFFIGIAPIYFGAAVMLLLLWLLVPSTFYGVANSASISDVSIVAVGDSLFGAFKAMFNLSNLSDFRWWIFMFAAFFIALHMTLSKKDIQGSFSGFAILSLIAFTICAVVGIISISALTSYTEFICAIGLYLLCFMTVALLLSVVAFIAGCIIRLIKKIVRI